MRGIKYSQCRMNTQSPMGTCERETLSLILEDVKVERMHVENLNRGEIAQVSTTTIEGECDLLCAYRKGSLRTKAGGHLLLRTTLNSY